ncbi:MAG: hypothetical protein M3P18_04685 [Actinomycetota bacterium]|nr:hypothetical protein [Actinomycetota bacterium]
MVRSSAQSIPPTEAVAVGVALGAVAVGAVVGGVFELPVVQLAKADPSHTESAPRPAFLRNVRRFMELDRLKWERAMSRLGRAALRRSG